MSGKKCDVCGLEFIGESYPVYNENHRKERGLVQCEECFSEGLTTGEIEDAINPNHKSKIP